MTNIVFAVRKFLLTFEHQNCEPQCYWNRIDLCGNHFSSEKKSASVTNFVRKKWLILLSDWPLFWLRFYLNFFTGKVTHICQRTYPSFGRASLQRSAAFHRQNHEKRRMYFRKRMNLLQNGILNFAISSSQFPLIAFQSKNLHRWKSDFLKRGLVVKL